MNFDSLERIAIILFFIFVLISIIDLFFINKVNQTFILKDLLVLINIPKIILTPLLILIFMSIFLNKIFFKIPFHILKNLGSFVVIDSILKYHTTMRKNTNILMTFFFTIIVFFNFLAINDQQLEYNKSLYFEGAPYSTNYVNSTYSEINSIDKQIKGYIQQINNSVIIERIRAYSPTLKISVNLIKFNYSYIPPEYKLSIEDKDLLKKAEMQKKAVILKSDFFKSIQKEITNLDINSPYIEKTNFTLLNKDIFLPGAIINDEQSLNIFIPNSIVINKTRNESEFRLLFFSNSTSDQMITNQIYTILYNLNSVGIEKNIVLLNQYQDNGQIRLEKLNKEFLSISFIISITFGFLCLSTLILLEMYTNKRNLSLLLLRGFSLRQLRSNLILQSILHLIFSLISTLISFLFLVSWYIYYKYGIFSITLLIDSSNIDILKNISILFFITILIQSFLVLSFFMKSNLRIVSKN